MRELSRWFDRKFPFGRDVGLQPNLRARLRGTPARLEEACASLAPALLTHKAAGSWSIQENAGHLGDLEQLWFERLQQFHAGAATLRAADLDNHKTHAASHDDRRLGAVLDEFRALRTRLGDALDRLAPADFARTALHPRLQQPLRLFDHLEFIAEHDDHHLARIFELRAGLESPA